MSLDKAARNALPDEQFAVPGKRKLPINDETHTRLAWDMVDRTQGLNDEERRDARARIKRRAEELGINTADWQIAAHVSFEAMALEVPRVDGHPNRMPFKGVLTRLDQPSDAPPHGSKGKRTVIPTEVARRALPSLLGMAVDYEPGFEGHDRKRKIGLITGADIVGDAIEIEGFFYAKDFPDECQAIKAEKEALGFSYELDARIRDLDADPWVIDYCVFTGAAVLYKELAAYHSTSLAAKAEQEITMTKEELQAILAESLKPINEGLTVVTEKVKELEAKGASLGGPIIDQVKPHVEACMAAADAMEAAGVGTHPTMGHAAHLRKIARHMAVEAATGKVPHIYNDHSYFDASPEAAALAAAAAAAKGADDESNKAIADVKKQVEDLGTMLKDLSAKAFTSAPAPDRKTIPGNVMTLLAKAKITEADIKDGKLSTEQVNAMLDAAGITGKKAIETKLKLRQDGLMQVGQA